jgi:hypothetical protein
MPSGLLLLVLNKLVSKFWRFEWERAAEARVPPPPLSGRQVRPPVLPA